MTLLIFRFTLQHCDLCNHEYRDKPNDPGQYFTFYSTDGTHALAGTRAVRLWASDPRHYHKPNIAGPTNPFPAIPPLLQQQAARLDQGCIKVILATGNNNAS